LFLIPNYNGRLYEMSLFVGAKHAAGSTSSSLREDRILEALFSFRNDIIEEILKLKQLLIGSVLQNKMYERARSDNDAQQQQLAVLLSEILHGKMAESFSMSQLPSDDTETDEIDECPSSSAANDENSTSLLREKDEPKVENAIVADEVAAVSEQPDLLERENTPINIEQSAISVKPEFTESLNFKSPSATQSWVVDNVAATNPSTASSRVLPVSIPTENESGEPLSETDFMYWSDAGSDFQEMPMTNNNGKQSYTCGECGKKFAYRSGLEKHFRIHTGVRPYKCKLCGKSFAQKGSLKYHIDIHTGQKRHKCSVCGKSFVHKGNLNYHVKTHHISKVPPLPLESPNSSQLVSSEKGWNDSTTADSHPQF